MKEKLIALFFKTRLLRHLQKEWFRTKDKKYLQQCFQMEKEVDDLLKEIEPLMTTSA
jgi:hypothetical protein